MRGRGTDAVESESGSESERLDARRELAVRAEISQVCESTWALLFVLIYRNPTVYSAFLARMWQISLLAPWTNVVVAHDASLSDDVNASVTCR